MDSDLAAQVQGDVIPGFRAGHRVYLLWQIDDRQRAKQALSDLSRSRSRSVSSAVDVLSVSSAVDVLQDRGDGRRDSVWLNVAFSRHGLDQLGITDDVRDDGGHFRLGIQAATDRMSESLAGDAAVVVIIAAHDEGMLAAGIENVTRSLSGGLALSGTLRGDAVSDGDGVQREPFGFRDGISEPEVAGAPDAGKAAPGQRALPIDRFIIRDSQGARANGSFLVLIKIEQDVQAFKKFCKSGAQVLNAAWELNGKLTPDDFAALLMGRRKDGRPLDLHPIAANGPPVGGDSLNDFRYANDRIGARCPLSAHIRKMNPRSPGNMRHVIMRRSIPYHDRENEKVGLLFACYQSSLADGFVHLQSLWADGPFSSHQSLMDKTNRRTIAASFKTPPKESLNIPPKEMKPIADVIDWGQLTQRFPKVPEAGPDPVVGLATRRGELGPEILNPRPRGGSTSVPIPLGLHWVTYRDGNYFFVPSLETLRRWFDEGSDPNPRLARGLR